MSFGHAKTNEELSVQVQQKTDQLNLLAGKIAEAEEQLKTYKDLSVSNADLQAQVIENQKELDNLRVELVTVKQAVHDLESRKDALESSADDAWKKLGLLNDDILEAEGKLKGIQKKSDEMIAMSLSNSKEADEKLSVKHGEIIEAEKKLEDVKAEISSAEKLTGDIKQALASEQPMLQAKQKELDKIQGLIELANQDLVSVQRDIEKAQREKKVLEETVGSMNSQIAAAQDRAEVAFSVRQKALEVREGEVSIKEKWLEHKTAQLQTFKAELEQFHGKPINVKV